MKQLVLLTGILLLVFSSFAGAQPFNWSYVEDFVTDLNSPHGLVVDLNGNIWIQPYSQADTVQTSPDTLILSALHVYDPSGNQIGLYWHGNLPGVGPDTLNFTGRGIAEDNNGNILVSNGYLYRINYQDGSFMNRWDWLDVPNNAQALTEAAADQNGYIYVTRVVPPNEPIVILAPDFTTYNYAVDTTSVISRSLVVSPDGKELYHGAIYPAAGAIHYHSDFGPDGTYSTVDTLLGPDPSAELWGQILDWDPFGRIWIGSYWDVTEPAYKGWYAIDPATNNVFKDSIGTNIFQVDTNYVLGDPPPGGTFAAPRGVDFWEENDGSWTAYTADFDGSIVKKWTNPQPPTGIIVVDNGKALISEFELRQNFPNPFNPATKIPFQLRNSAHVKLVIYNVSGQVVKTLVNEKLSAGSYEYDFNASEMASGTYFYRITVDGNTLTKRMMLLK